MVKHKRIKRLFLIMVTAFLVAVHFSVPLSAADNQDEGFTFSRYDHAKSFQKDDLSFSGIDYFNFIEGSDIVFGIEGKVSNSYAYSITFTSTFYGYTKDDVLIANGSSEQTIEGDSQDDYELKFNANTLAKKYQVGDIDHITLKIDCKEYKNPTTPSLNSKYKNQNYVIDKYDIDVEVGEDNVYTITENITAYFMNSRHGIFRILPLTANIKRLDGTSSLIRTPVELISVSDNYITSHEDGGLKVKIGNESKYVHGKKEYSIKYKYNYGIDKNPNYDELYLNLIGTEWNTAIGNISFIIHMPKGFDESRVGFSHGIKSSTNSDGVAYIVSDNTIQGTYDGILGSGEGLTIRVELEDGYFSSAKTTIKTYEYLDYAIPIICAIIALILWLLVGRDEHTTEIATFYPPEGLSSLDVAMIVNGHVSSRDVVSLLFMLANKGYIRIEETKLSESYRKPEYTFYKLKEYDGEDENERLFMNGLFNENDKITSKGIKTDADGVTSESLEDEFYKTINVIKERVNDKTNHSKYFENTTWARVIIAIMMIVTYVSMPLAYGFANNNMDVVLLALFMLALYGPFFAAGFFIKMPIFLRFFWLGFTTFHCSIMGFAFFSTRFSDIFVEPFYVAAFLIMVVSELTMAVSFYYMPRRTPLGVELYGKIKGLESYMKNVDKTHFEQLLSDDKNYSYLLFPYAFVLGVSSKWMEQFASLGNNKISSPDWYTGDEDFMSDSLAQTMDSMSSSVSSSLSSSPSSGSDSGGGSSGDGGGGGGGGDW